MSKAKQQATAQDKKLFKYEPKHPVVKKHAETDVFHGTKPKVGVIRQKADAETIANFGKHGLW